MKRCLSASTARVPVKRDYRYFHPPPPGEEVTEKCDFRGATPVCRFTSCFQTGSQEFSLDRFSPNIVLVFGCDVVGNFEDHSFRLAFELPPNPPCCCSSGSVCGNSDQAKTPIKFLRVSLGSPPVRTGRFNLRDRIVKTDCIVDGVSRNPRFFSDPIGKIGGVITHPRYFRLGQRPGFEGRKAKCFGHGDIILTTDTTDAPMARCY